MNRVQEVYGRYPKVVPGHTCMECGAKLEGMVYRDDLVTLMELAKRLEVNDSLPYQWLRRFDNTPEPVMKIGAISLYDYSQWEAWLEWRANR